MKALTAPLTELGSFQQILEGIAKGNTPVFATGVIDAAKTHLAYSLQAEIKRPLFLLTYSELRAKEILEDLTFFTKDCAYYPAKDILFYSADVHSMEMNRQRFLVLERLLKGETPIIVASAEALLDKYPQKEIFAAFRLTLRTGEIVEIAELTRKLVRMGYERTELVESPGQFSLRGGILDIWSLTAEDAVRIEFWDDEIDSIRSMDAQSQRSVEKLEEASIFPLREMVYTEEQAVSAAERIEQEYRKVLKNLEQKGEKERYLFGFEESYGYLAGTYARDKDAVVASMLICEMAANYKLKGVSILTALNNLYAKYGFYIHRQQSFTCEGAAGMEQMKAIMTSLRTDTPKEIAGVAVTSFSDYLASETTDLQTGEKTAIELPKSDVLSFALANGNSIVLRPSGTEPKIKAYYTGISDSKEGALAAIEEMKVSFTKVLGF